MIATPDMRECKTCRFRLPADAHHFAPSRWRKDGTPALRGDCRRCQSAEACARDRKRRTDPADRATYLAARGKSARKYRARHPEKVRAIQRNYRAMVNADPEKVAARREKDRIYERAWRARLTPEELEDRRARNREYGRKRRASEREDAVRRRGFGKGWWDEPDYEPITTTSGGLVDAAPLLEFVRSAFPNANSAELARLLCIDGSGAKRIFTGEHKRVSLNVVDRALTVGLGRPDLLDVLYPEEAVA